MHLHDFDYFLPPERIARYPKPRGTSRLLTLSESGVLGDHYFSELIDFLKPGDCLVFNNTRVIPARAYARKSTGGRVEMLVERIVSEKTAWCHLRNAGKSPIGAAFILEEGQAHLLQRDNGLFLLDFEAPVLEYLSKYGEVPLPPYLERAPEAADSERYQTVYAKHPGAVAAPTAGLHFDTALLERLKEKQIHMTEVTLHVGAGTFQPVKTHDITQHVMHAEWLEVSRQTCEIIQRARAQGGRIIAVGTTSVRSLETAAQSGTLQPYSGDTRLFIYPGYQFKVIDGLVTNFHLPQSSLLMLVSALAGRETILRAYQHAIDHQYDFFSYGDAMFILKSEL